MYKYLSLCEEREKFRRHLIDVIKEKRKEERERVFCKFSKCTEEIGQEEEGNDDILRYYYYLTQGIDDAYVGSMDADLLEHILKRVPIKWRNKFKDCLDYLVKEVKEEYILNVKKSVIEFVIGDSMYSSLKQVRLKFDISNL